MEKAKIVRINDEHDGVKSFTLGFDKKIDFTPGQYMMLSYPDDPETKRAFSIVGHEKNKNELNFIIKKQGVFTSRLFNSSVNQELLVNGPYGRFCLSKEQKPSVMIAGGVGITPFYSMLLDINKNNHKKGVHLFYSAKSKEEMLLIEKLKKINQTPINIHFFFTQKPDPEGSNCRINASIIRDRVKEFETSDFFICGPKNMIESMRKDLSLFGIDDERIKSEDFE